MFSVRWKLHCNATENSRSCSCLTCNIQSPICSDLWPFMCCQRDIFTRWELKLRVCLCALIEFTSLLPCALINSRALSSTLVRFRQVSCALINSYALLTTLMCSHRLLYVLINFRVLLSTLVRSQPSCALIGSRALSTLMRSYQLSRALISSYTPSSTLMCSLQLLRSHQLPSTLINSYALSLSCTLIGPCAPSSTLVSSRQVSCARSHQGSCALINSHVSLVPGRPRRYSNVTSPDHPIGNFALSRSAPSLWLVARFAGVVRIGLRTRLLSCPLIDSRAHLSTFVYYCQLSCALNSHALS